MKKLLCLGLIYFGALALPLIGDSAERSVTVDGKDFVIRYEFGGTFGYVTIPLTNPLGRPHHQGAKITVYKKRGKNLIFLRESRGVYVEGEPCFEDDPEKTVRSALSEMNKTLNPNKELEKQ